MAGSARAELATSSPTRYPNGHRGAHSGASSDRSGSLREGAETRALASGSGASRNNAEAAMAGQHLNLEPFSLPEQKYTRYNELRRVLGVTLEEQHSFGSTQPKPLPSTEEVKRFKSSVQEQFSCARDRRKLLNESILKLDKYCTTLSKKQQRNEVPSYEKKGKLNSSRIGGQVHRNSSDHASQRLEERAKNGVVPNKRVRSSMVDARSEGRSAIHMRSGMVIDKDKSVPIDTNRNMLRSCNGASPSEDKVSGIPAGADGWEKKLKRKRSVGTMITRVPDGDQEHKQPIAHRPTNETHPRSCDGIGFRLHARDDVHVAGQNQLSKGKPSGILRPGPGPISITTSIPCSPGGINGWEQPSFLNKVQSLNGVTDHKRPFPTGPSSSPVAQWVGQRSQKMSRTRRAHVVSPVSNIDESHLTSEGCAVLPEVGSGLPTTEPRSEELNSMKITSKDKEIDNGGIEGEALDAVHKVPDHVLPAKKNKNNMKEEIGNGVRRQGRSGRGSLQSKGYLSVAKDKTEKVDSIKPLKRGRHGSDKGESKVGRQPSKKASDRKSCIRPGQTFSSASSEINGESETDWEELVAAAKFAHNSSYILCSSSFWKKIEPIFAFISPEAINYVKHQISFAEELDESKHNKLDADHKVMGELPCNTVPSTQTTVPIGQVSQSHVDVQHKYDEQVSIKTTSEKLESDIWFESFDKIIPLSQRLLSAFIAEDVTEDIDFSTEQGDAFLQYANNSLPEGHDENGPEVDLMKFDHDLDVHFNHNKSCSSNNITCNGYMDSRTDGSPKIHKLTASDKLLEINDLQVPPDKMDTSELGQTKLNQPRLMEPATGFSVSPFECQFNDMSLDHRLLMELHSIDLYPETVPELAEREEEEIDKVISELKMKLYEQARKKNDAFSKLEKDIHVRKEIEERKLEQLAMSKLVEMAYKRLSGRHGSSHKSGASKLSKQLALAFAKRTLARCRNFEETGRSCFSEPLLHDAIFSPSLYKNDAKSVSSIGVASAANIYSNSNARQFGHQMPGVTPINERHEPKYKLGSGQMNPVHGLTHLPEQTFAANGQMPNKGKKKEVLLDVVTSVTSRAMATLNHSIPGGAKLKRIDKEIDLNKDMPAKNSTAKAIRPSSGTRRGEHKTKTKPKQKIAQLSTSGNGLARVMETSNFVPPSMQESRETVQAGGSRISQEANVPSSGDVPKEIEGLHVIDSIDELDVEEELGQKGQDIASWLNVGEDGLQDVDVDGLQEVDLVGLGIPMDDLSELKFNF